MKQCGYSRSVQQLSNLSVTVKPHFSQNFLPISLMTCMCKYIPTASVFSVTSFSNCSIMRVPIPYFRQGSNIPIVRIQAYFCSLNSSTRTVKAPTIISLQKQNFESWVYLVATFMQKGVAYLTGNTLKFIFLSMFIFFSFMSPNSTFSFFFSAICFLDLKYLYLIINYFNKSSSYLIMRALSFISKCLFTNSNKIVTVTHKQENKSSYIRMTNVKKRNTLSLQAISLLKQSFQKVAKRVALKQTKIVILQGEGPVFCSGHDLKQLGSSKNCQQIFDSCAGLMLTVRNFPVPTLCVINGIAAAAGFQLAMACDMIVASQKSTFSTPGVKWGLFCSTPGVQLIRSINSQKKANQMLLFGQSITSQQAFQYGLVNRIVPENKLELTVEEYITKINNLSTQVIIHGKSVLRDQKNHKIQDAYKVAGLGMSQNIKQKEDCKQGLKAFSQKRHPHFKN